MLIESIIRRKNGTTVNLGADKYIFLPTPKDEAHVCEVKDEAHIKRLLNIREGFKPHSSVGDKLAVKFSTLVEPEVKEAKRSQKKFDLHSPENLGEFVDSLDTESLNNKELYQIAQFRLKIDNYKSRETVKRFSADEIGVDLDERKTPPEMIRDLLKAMQAQEFSEANDDDTDDDFSDIDVIDIDPEL